MSCNAPPPAIPDPSPGAPAAPRRLAHQMAIDACMPLGSPLLQAFDDVARSVDAERAVQHLKALHRVVDEAFEHQVKTMFATEDTFQRLVLEAAQPPEGHRGH